MNKCIGLIIVTLVIPLCAADHRSDVRYPSERMYLRTHQYKTLENHNGSDADYSSEAQLIKPRFRRILDKPMQMAMKESHKKLVDQKKATFENYRAIMHSAHNDQCTERFRL